MQGYGKLKSIVYAAMSPYFLGTTFEPTFTN